MRIFAVHKQLLPSPWQRAVYWCIFATLCGATGLTFHEHTSNQYLVLFPGRYCIAAQSPYADEFPTPQAADRCNITLTEIYAGARLHIVETSLFYVPQWVATARNAAPFYAVNAQAQFLLLAFIIASILALVRYL